MNSDHVVQAFEFWVLAGVLAFVFVLGMFIGATIVKRGK